MKIYTHQAPHHIDEVVAIAIIKTKHAGEEIDVVETSVIDPMQIDDGDYVIDVGRKYNPERGFFDHHQIDDPSISAMSLVVEDVMPELKADESFMDFVDTKSVSDNRGPYCLLHEMTQGNSGQFFAPFNSLFLIERAVVSMQIEESTDLLRHILITPILEKIKIRDEMLRDEHVSLTCYSRVALLSFREKALDREFTRIRNEVSDILKVDSGQDLLVSVYPGSRDPENTVEIRRESKCSFDLHLLSDAFPDAVSFVHNSGFLAVMDIPFSDKERVGEVIEWLNEQLA